MAAGTYRPDLDFQYLNSLPYSQVQEKGFAEFSYKDLKGRL